jgi:hypothetical protein
MGFLRHWKNFMILSQWSIWQNKIQLYLLQIIETLEIKFVNKQKWSLSFFFIKQINHKNDIRATYYSKYLVEKIGFIHKTN